MNKVIIPIIFTIILTGCVSTKNRPFVPDVVKDISSSDVACVKREAPNFSNMKLGNSMFGAIGAFAAISSGNAYIKNNNVEDPAIAIKDGLLKHLSDTYSSKIIESNIPEIKTTSAKEIAGIFKGKSDYVLDVQTVNWSCCYLPFNWFKYRTLYSAKLRLVDVSSGEKVAEGFYYWRTPKGYNYTNNRELFEDSAKELKCQLSIAEAEAIEHFKSKVLTIL